MARRKAKNKHYGVSKPLLQRIRGMRPAAQKRSTSNATSVCNACALIYS